jgi:hypothetical protein
MKKTSDAEIRVHALSPSLTSEATHFLSTVCEAVETGFTGAEMDEDATGKEALV